MFSKKSVTCFQQDRSNGIWPANELTKSFCLRPTTVFVLFYFSTVMAISVIPAIYYYYTLCSLVDFDYLERENVLFFSCFFTTGYKTCFNVFFIITSMFVTITVMSQDFREIWWWRQPDLYTVFPIFIAPQHTDARYWCRNLSVRLSVRPSVRHVPVLYGNGLTYCHSFFTAR